MFKFIFPIFLVIVLVLSCASNKKKPNIEKKDERLVPPLEEELNITGNKLIHFKTEEEFLNYDPEQDSSIKEPGLDFDISSLIPPPSKTDEEVVEDKKDEEEKGEGE